MGLSSQVAVVVPCLNEDRSIHSLVTEVRQILPHVLVVDDGSTDRTASDAARAGARVLNHAVPRGKGLALHTGFSFAFNEGFEWVLAMDGDGQHASADIPRFLARAEGHPFAMIIGDRMQNSGAMPPLRRAVNRWMSRRLGAYCGTPLADSQCGFRMINLPAWKRFRFSAEHFEIESELIVRFLKAGLAIDFVPVQTRYASECSKIRPFRDTIRWLRWWKTIRRELAAHKNGLVSREPQFAPSTQDATA
jgi:glycosyltransferase involved in cell wall biosynthesis